MEHLWDPGFRQEYRAPAIRATNSYWPSQTWRPPIPSAPSLLRRRPLSPHRMPLSPRSKNTFNIKPMTYTHKNQAAAITNPTLGSSRIEECMKRFKEFHSGKGAFRSSAGEQALRLKISTKEFVSLKKLLDDNDDGEEEG